MKNKNIAIIMILILLVFTISFYIYAIKTNAFAMPYDKYYGVGKYDSTPCEFKQLENGYTQLENCAKYKPNLVPKKS